MKVYPYQTLDGIIDLVEKQELDEMTFLAHDLSSQISDLEVLVNKLDRKLNAAKDLIELLEDALIEIEASLYEDDSENAAADASWHIARKVLKKLKEQSL